MEKAIIIPNFDIDPEHPEWNYVVMLSNPIARTSEGQYLFRSLFEGDLESCKKYCQLEHYVYEVKLIQ